MQVEVHSAVDMFVNIEVRIGNLDISGQPQTQIPTTTNARCVESGTVQPATNPFDLICTSGAIDGQFVTLQKLAPATDTNQWNILHIDVLEEIRCPDTACPDPGTVDSA